MDSKDLLRRRKLDKYNPDTETPLKIFCDRDRYIFHQFTRFN